jgi:NADH:ubiquinone oxidoreductase subunit 4 (subunit M)
MAGAGIPGMVGFIAEFAVFQGGFRPSHTDVGGDSWDSTLTAVYFVIC